MSDTGWGDDDSPGAHFGDNDEDGEPDGSDQPDTNGETRTVGGDDLGETGTDSTIDDTPEASTEGDQDPVTSPIPLDELNVNQQYSPRMLARSMAPADYRDDPSGGRVPFAVWRDGVGHGRNRKTFEIQPDVEQLERDVLDKLDEQLGDRPPLTDLREIALVYGLAHWEDLAEMADELGIQYDS